MVPQDRLSIESHQMAQGIMSCHVMSCHVMSYGGGLGTVFDPACRVDDLSTRTIFTSRELLDAANVIRCYSFCSRFLASQTPIAFLHRNRPEAHSIWIGKHGMFVRSRTTFFSLERVVFPHFHNKDGPIDEKKRLIPSWKRLFRPIFWYNQLPSWRSQ